MKKLLFLLSLLSSVAAVADVSVTDLSSEFMRNPRGIETAAPRLSWKLNSDQRDVVQTAYRVEVASSAENLAAGIADLWDSGRVASDQSYLVPYDGVTLSARQRVYWRATVWTDAEAPSRSEETATWEMGLLHPSDWQAEWIGGGDVAPNSDPLVQAWSEEVVFLPPPSRGFSGVPAHYEERARAQQSERIATVKASQPAVWLRKKFVLPQAVTKATLYSTALGYYELYLDGHKISDRVLDPGQTDYEKRVLYNIDDLTAKLKSGGPHELRILLAEGWYGQSQGFFNANFRYGNPLARSQLELQFADGTQVTVATDPTWEFAASSITKANLYSGEVVDGRQGEADLQWQPAAGPLHDQPLPEKLEAQLLPPVQKVRSIPTQSVIESRPGVWLFDLGENIAGWPRLRINAPRGTAIDLRFAELMTPDNRINWGTQGRGAVGVYQWDRYIAAGTGPEYYEPRFTYHGFRYVEVTGLTSAPSIDDLTAYLVRSDVASIGHFESSDPLMNQLHETIRRTYESNLVSIPSDCPIREKCGWLGDAHVTQEMSYYNYDMAQFWAKYAHDIRTTSDLNNGLPDSIVPGRRPGIDAFDWGVATVFIPWQHYQHTGDRRVLEEQWDYMVKFMDYSRRISRDWIIHQALGDWCDQPVTIALSMTRPDGSPFNSLPATTATMHFFYAAKVMAEMAEVLGRSADAQRYGEWREAIRTAINQNYFHVRGNTYGSQTGNALAIMYGIPAADKIPVVAKVLAQEIKLGNDGHFNVGSHGATYLYHALTDYGQAEVARGIFAQTTYPSYGYMFSLGATTLWENMSRYDPVTKSTGKSLSHPFHGGFDHWFYEAVAGLRRDRSAPAFKQLLFRSDLVGQLNHAKASIETPYGTAASSWQITGDQFSWEIRIPANTRATVHFPETVTLIRESEGALATTATEFKGLPVTRAVELGSGTYRFEARFQP